MFLVTKGTRNYYVWQVTSSYKLHQIVNDCPVEIQLHKRFLKFFRSIITSDNELVNLCGKLVLKGSGSAICDNVNYIWYKYGIMYSKYEVASFSNEVSTICGYEQLYDVGVAIRVSNIMDFIHMRDI